MYEPAGNDAVVDGDEGDDELDGTVSGASALCMALTLLSSIHPSFVLGLFLLVQPNHQADNQGRHDGGHHNTDEAYPLPSASACDMFIVPHLP